MKLFASWSGGKDCMLALFRMLQQKKYKVSYLINMCEAGTYNSRSHGLPRELIVEQALNIGISLIQKETDFGNYEMNFKRVIHQLKNEGVEGGIFGDIYLQAHRDWIERVCGELGIIPYFPLWEEDTGKLLKEFIDAGFQATIVSVRKDNLGQEWLGQNLDNGFLKEILKTDIDPCAENGEFHTFVYDGPIFENAVNIKTDGIRSDDRHWYLTIHSKQPRK